MFQVKACRASAGIDPHPGPLGPLSGPLGPGLGPDTDRWLPPRPHLYGAPSVSQICVN